VVRKVLNSEDFNIAWNSNDGQVALLPKNPNPVQPQTNLAWVNKNCKFAQEAYKGEHEALCYERSPVPH